MGPDLLAQDAVLKRLLESAPADPHAPVQPMRDPVGAALGMVARLTVAASAAGGIAMLLFGVVPLPFRIRQTFDPEVLRRLHVVGFRPDLAKARDWYEKAAGYGSSEAAARLNALPRDSAPLN
jgi:hypothetical protein